MTDPQQRPPLRVLPFDGPTNPTESTETVLYVKRLHSASTTGRGTCERRRNADNGFNSAAATVLRPAHSLTPAQGRAHHSLSSRHDQTPRSFPAAAVQFAGRTRPHDLAGANAVYAEPLRSLRTEPELQAPQRRDGEIVHPGRRAAAGGDDELQPVHSQAIGAAHEDGLAAGGDGGEVGKIRAHYAWLIAAIRGSLKGIDAAAMIRRLRDEKTAMIRAAKERRSLARRHPPPSLPERKAASSGKQLGLG